MEELTLPAQKLSNERLKQAVLEYGSGEISKITLTRITKKDRRLLSENLTLFFDEQGWVFNEQSARSWVESKRITKKGLPAKESSIGRYVAQIRAFNQFCIERKYLTINFCEWIAKPPESQRLKPHVDLSHDVLLKAISLGTMPTTGDRKPSLETKKDGRDALEFMLFTGRRSGEFVKLKGSDIQLNADEPKYFATLKGGKRLDFPIPENLIPMMKERQHKERVFKVTAATTIDYLQNGLRKLGIAEEVIKEVNNHTLRKAFAKERYRNGDSVEEIADAMADTVEVVRKYYLGRDMKKLKDTVNNTKEAKGTIDMKTILNDIIEYAEVKASDSRFQVHIVKKLADRFILEIPFASMNNR